MGMRKDLSWPCRIFFFFIARDTALKETTAESGMSSLLRGAVVAYVSSSALLEQS